MICLFLYLIQRGNYNYILGRRLLLTGVFFYLVPVQLVKYLLPKDALPETMLIGRKADSYLSGTLSFWSEKQGGEASLPRHRDFRAQKRVREAVQKENSEAAGKAHESYVIQPGDTLFQISMDRYGSIEAISQICKLNGMSADEIIYPGQVIVLP